jgi:hypothetical protein
MMRPKTRSDAHHVNCEAREVSDPISHQSHETFRILNNSTVCILTSMNVLGALRHDANLQE